jgi:hypothetical protein
MITPVSLLLVMPLSNDFIMKLNVAYNFQSTCPINLILEICNLFEQSLCDNKNDIVILLDYFWIYVPFK